MGNRQTKIHLLSHVDEQEQTSVAACGPRLKAGDKIDYSEHSFLQRSHRDICQQCAVRVTVPSRRKAVRA